MSRAGRHRGYSSGEEDPLGTLRATPILLWAFGPWVAAHAADFEVPTAQTPTLASAVALAQDGDRVRIDAAIYKGEDPGVTIDMDLEIEGLNGRPRLPPLFVENASVRLTSAWLSGTRLLVAVPLEDLPTVVLTESDYDSWPYALWAENASIEARDVLVSNPGGNGIHAVTAEVDVEDFEATGFPAATAFVFQAGSVVDMRGGSISNAAFSAIGVANSEVDVQDVTFTGNAGIFGADVFAIGDGERVRLDGITSTGASTVAEGGSIYADGVELDLDDVRIESAAAEGCGGALYAKDATTTADGLVFDDVEGITGGGLCVHGGSFDAVGVQVLDATATEDGGFLWAKDADVSIAALAVETSPGGVAADNGGVVAIEGGSLDLVDPTVTGLALLGDGGVIFAKDASVTLTGGLMEQVQADEGGIAWVEGGGLTWTGGTVRQCAATNGSVIHARGSAAVTLRDGLFVENSASSQGTVDALVGTVITVERSRFCRNHAAVGSGLALSGGSLLDVVTNTVFLGNDATDPTAGSTIAVLGRSMAVGGSRVTVRNVDFVEDVAARAVVYANDADVSVRNGLFFGAATAASEDGTGGPKIVGAFDLFHDPSGDAPDVGDAPGFGSTATVIADPQFQGWSSMDCDSNLWLRAASPARDAGDPLFLDPDGSRSDIGAYGGPDADLADADSDGVFEDLDCDDADPETNGGMAEVPYDGIDQDCDGSDLVDADGDGHAALIALGDDCDDTDPLSFPGATETAYDGIDQDCDGEDLVDVDGDGFAGWTASGPDCDDADGAVHPDASEAWYDGVDQDCDGNDDDRDLDGFAADVVGGTDCDDDDEDVHPGMAEIANDLIDQDCDGYMDRTRLTGSGGFGCDGGCHTSSSSGGMPVLGVLLLLMRRRALRAESRFG